MNGWFGWIEGRERKRVWGLWKGGWSKGWRIRGLKGGCGEMEKLWG